MKLFHNNPALKEAVLLPFHLAYRLNERFGLSLIYFLKSGKWPNLDRPKTFHEKMQWIKLNYRPALYPICADKYSMRSYVEQKGLGRLLNEHYWVGEDARDIPFAQLPDQFVLKTTHGCGYNLICRDKSRLNLEETVGAMNRWRDKKYMEAYGEWFYGKLTPRILCEKLLEGDKDSQAPKDFKVMCFNGVPRLIQVDVGRFTDGHFRNVYDPDWKLLDYRIYLPNRLDHVEPRPSMLEDMLDCARVLSQPFPFARIDFYITGGKLVVGEITLTPGAGFDFHYSPQSFTRQMSEWLTLPAPCRYPGEQATGAEVQRELCP